MMFLTYIHQTSNLYTSFSDTDHTMMRPNYIFLCIPLNLKAIHYIVVLYVLYDVYYFLLCHSYHRAYIVCPTKQLNH